MTKPISTILPHLFKQEQAWKIQLLQEWQTIFGNLSTFVQIEKIENDTLILGVTNSCWLQEFYLLSPLLLKTINEKLANAPIKQLRFKLQGTKHHPSKRKHTPPQPRVRKHVVLSDREKEALTHIQDVDLRNALERFLIRCYQE